MNAPPVFVFDLDGVLFDTEQVKMAAFRDAFAPLCGDDRTALQRVDDYNRRHRGVPRAAKIQYILDALLPAPEPGRHDLVAARYAELLRQRLPACAPLRGVRAFLQDVPAVRYVASSAPVHEVRAHLERHGLADRFTEIFADPTTKVEALRVVADRHRDTLRVYFGDAPADLQAARTTGTAFVAINANSQLAAVDKDGFDDFSAVDAILARIRSAGAPAVGDQPLARPAGGGGGSVPIG